MKGKVFWIGGVVVLLLAVGVMVAVAQTDTLVDNGDGTITDCDIGIMWLKDAKAQGSMSLTYLEALDYVDSLNTNTHLGYNDWRLPEGTNPSSDTCATLDNQYFHNCTDTEFSHLFYDELGGCSGWTLDRKCVGYTTEPNDDPELDLFDNLPTPSNTASANAYIYWTSMQPDDTHAWTFSFHGGSYKAIASDSTYQMQAWVVRDFTGECEEPEYIPECRDGIDNDGDGFIDYAEDMDCMSRSSDSELPYCIDVFWGGTLCMRRVPLWVLLLAASLTAGSYLAFRRWKFRDD